jgi:hypothetical protein
MALLVLFGVGSRPASATPNWLIQNPPPSQLPSGHYRALWQQQDPSDNVPTGAFSIWTFDSSGAMLESSPIYEPNAGWVFDQLNNDTTDDGGVIQFHGVHSDGYTPNGSYSFWIISSTGVKTSSSNVLSKPGWTADLDYEANGTPFLFWTENPTSSGTPTGTYQIWTLNSSYNYVAQSAVFSAPGWTTYGVDENPNGGYYLFWTQVGSDGYTPTGTYAIWTLDSSFNLLSSAQTYSKPGWTAYGAVFVTGAGNNVLLWTQSTPYGSTATRSFDVWALKSDYSVASKAANLTAPGWTCDFPIPQSNGDYLLFWRQQGTTANNTSNYDSIYDNGNYSFWTVSPTGNYISSSNVLSAPGWTAQIAASGGFPSLYEETYNARRANARQTPAARPKATSSATQVLFWTENSPSGSSTPTGQYALWALDANNNYVSATSSSAVLSAPGWLASPWLRPDGIWTMLWSQFDTNGALTGDYAMWKLNSHFNEASSSPVLALYGYKISDVNGATPYFDTQDDSMQILWYQPGSYSDPNGDSVSGNYTIWNLDTDANHGTTSVLPAAGWTLTPLQVTNGKMTQLFWDKIDPSTYGDAGAYSFWNLTATGAISGSTYEYGPY